MRASKHSTDLSRKLDAESKEGLGDKLCEILNFIAAFQNRDPKEKLEDLFQDLSIQFDAAFSTVENEWRIIQQRHASFMARIEEMRIARDCERVPDEEINQLWVKYKVGVRTADLKHAEEVRNQVKRASIYLLNARSHFKQDSVEELILSFFTLGRISSILENLVNSPLVVNERVRVKGTQNRELKHWDLAAKMRKKKPHLSKAELYRVVCREYLKEHGNAIPITESTFKRDFRKQVFKRL